MGKEKVNDTMVRINTRVSKDVNDWLENENVRTGVPKSTLIFLALENYIQQKKAMEMVGDITAVMQKLDDLESKLKQN